MIAITAVSKKSINSFHNSLPLFTIYKVRVLRRESQIYVESIADD